MKLQASDASALEGLQSQNLSRPENRLSVNGLAIVHGRFETLVKGFRHLMREPVLDRPQWCNTALAPMSINALAKPPTPTSAGVVRPIPHALIKTSGCHRSKISCKPSSPP